MTAIEPTWVNSDIAKMAREMSDQAQAIADDEPFADDRRSALHEAAGHLHLAFAALTGMPLAPINGWKERKAATAQEARARVAAEHGVEVAKDCAFEGCPNIALVVTVRGPFCAHHAASWPAETITACRDCGGDPIVTGALREDWRCPRCAKAWDAPVGHAPVAWCGCGAGKRCDAHAGLP